MKQQAGLAASALAGSARTIPSSLQSWRNLPIRIADQSFIAKASHMPTRNIVPGARQHELADALVRSGRCQNASEVPREGLRLIEERERVEDAKLKALKKAARQGWSDIAAGRYTDISDDQLEDFVAQMGRRAALASKVEANVALSAVSCGAE